MSGSQGKHRRRRTGSTTRRYKPAELVPIVPRRRGNIDKPEIAAGIGVALVVGVLIALIWIVTAHGINEQLSDIRDRAERAVSAQAATLAEEIRHEMLVVDQSLIVLQTAWNRDPDKFNLADWPRQLPALTSVASDIFIADENWVVRQSILPSAVGQQVGGNYVNFPRGSLEALGGGAKPPVGQMLVGDTGQTVETRRYLMYIIQPLDRPANWKIGASYRSEGFARLFSQASLGINGVTGLIDTQRGVVQAIAGPSARKPTVEVVESEMLKFFQNKGDSGIWTGPTAMDAVVRIHGFSKVEGRDMLVVVGVTEVEALAPAASLASGATSVAASATLVVLMIGGFVLWEVFTLRANRRRQRNHARRQAELESLQTEVTVLRARAALSASQVRALLQGTDDGVALLDPALRIIAWNHRFVSGCGLPSDLLRDGLPIDALLRQQAHAGFYGSLGTNGLDDIEIEVARREAILRTEPAGAILPQFALDGTEVGMHVEVIHGGGGLVLILGGLRYVQSNVPYIAAGGVTTPPGDPSVPSLATLAW